MKMFRLTLVFAVLLAGCDDPTVITHVYRDPSIHENDLVAMQSHGGIPVEMHGVPWQGASKAELAEAMTGPAGAARIRFRAQDIVGPSFHGSRMVLHFNPPVPNGAADCALTSESTGGEPPDRGFAVNMTICRDTRVEAQGYLKALETSPGDVEAFARAMRQLLTVVFREEKDR